MKKTFKVVFNKARGALMAVNEATSSIQAKGTKTIVATAVSSALLMGAGLASATSVTADEMQGASGKNEVVADGVLNITGSLSLTSQRISDLLESIGKEDNMRAFF